MIPYRHWKTYKLFRHWPPASETQNSSGKSVFPTVFQYSFLHLQPINHPRKDTWDVSGVYRKLLMCAAQRNIWYLGTRECPWDTRSRQGRVQPWRLRPNKSLRETGLLLLQQQVCKREQWEGLHVQMMKNPHVDEALHARNCRLL